MKSNKKFFIGLTVAVLLPFSFYLIAKILKKDRLVMPKYYLAEDVVFKTKNGKETTDTLYHKVANLEVTNQVGDKVGLNVDLPSKMLLISFISLEQDQSSQVVTKNISYFLEKAFRKNDTTVQFISISLKNVSDSFIYLKKYANQFSVNPDNWWFVSADESNIKNYIDQELGIKKIEQLTANRNMLNFQDLIILVDKQRYIRGYYNAKDTLDLKRCADDVGLISMQKRKK